MASFSSRGPTQEKTIKPDVVAPGQDVFSGGYAVGPFPTPFIGFGSVSGTSMATPTLRVPPRSCSSSTVVDAGDGQVGADDDGNRRVFLNNAKTQRAGVLDRGAGRIDLAQAGNPGLAVDKPSLSGGETSAGASKTFTVRATSIIGSADTWDVTGVATTAGLAIAPSTPTLALGAGDTRAFQVTLGTATGAATGNYEARSSSSAGRPGRSCTSRPGSA